jgi:hypothetical protein
VAPVVQLVSAVEAARIIVVEVQRGGSVGINVSVPEEQIRVRVLGAQEFDHHDV